MRRGNRRGKSVLGFREKLRSMLKCIRSGEQVPAEKEDHSSDSLATRDYSASGYSSRPGEADPKLDNSNIEEAESLLRESGYLNYEEARALLGRLEYQKGNIEAALHVFEGIDIAAVTPKIKASISQRFEQNRRRSQSDAAPAMSMHAVSLLLEAVFLKAKSLQGLRRYEESAESCKIILDTIESALPDGLPENLGSDCKLQETLAKAVELLPELWKLAGDLYEAILSYRRALLYKWNLEIKTKAYIEKEFAIFLLYSGCDVVPPNLRSQIDDAFVPTNNLEEAVLLLLVLLGRFVLGMIAWDTSVIDHLSYALSVSGEISTLAYQIERLSPTAMERGERNYILALCYYAEGKSSIALNLLKNILSDRERKDSVMELLLASKICSESSVFVEEGIGFARKANSILAGKCGELTSVSNCLLGVLLSAESQSVVFSDSERVLKQNEALEALESLESDNPFVVFHLCLENAEQRKLDSALYYAKRLLRIEAGSNLRSYVLLARILSAQKRYEDAETVIDVAIEQSGKWDHGELLRTKAKLQIEQDQLKNAVQTYIRLLAVLQVQAKSAGYEKKLLIKNRRKHDRTLETETWHDLAKLYTSLSQWRDAEICLSKSRAIDPHSASRWHCTGLLNEAKGLQQEALNELNEANDLHQEALKSFTKALDADPTHAPSLIATARILRQLGGESSPVARSFLMDALRNDRNSPSARYNLGLLYKADVGISPLEAAECFQAAVILEESAPIEPFR